MMSPHFILHPSRYFMGLLLLIHIGAMLLVITLPLKWWAYLLIAIVLFVSLIYHIQKHVYYHFAKSIKGLTNVEPKIWHLTQRNGEMLNAILQGDSVITRHFLILNFKVPQKKNAYLKRSIVVFNDAMGATAFRQLRLLCLQQK